MREIRNGRYTLLRTLGEGSQAETWEARANEQSKRPDPTRLASDFAAYVNRAKTGAGDRNPRGLVAIKCFRVAKAKEWKDVELAEREANTLAALDHPNLPKYLEHFEEDGALYLVMEKIEGESLVPGKTREVDVVRMLEDIGGALHYIHGRSPSLVHRDVKPGNIIRRPDGSYALVDFGAVRDRLKPAGGSTVVGTFGYMAPEQFQGRASPQSDLYALGATALAMISGRQPEDLPHEGLGIDVKASLPRGTSRALRDALSEMLEPNPDRRASSIDEVLATLRKQPKKEKRRKRKRRAPRKPRAPRPRPERTGRGSAAWRIVRLAVVAATFAGWYFSHKLALVFAGALFLFMLEYIRRVLVEGWGHFVKPDPPQVRVATDEEQARVRIAEEERQEEEDATEDQQEEEEEPRGKLRR